MRAAWREAYGGPQVVEVREIEKPVPTGNEVLVRGRRGDRLPDDRLQAPSRAVRLGILDVDAHHPLRRWRRALKPRGVYVAQGGSGLWMLSLLFWQPMLKLATDKTMGLLLTWKPFKPEDVEELKRLVASGTLKPAIDRRYPLDQAVDALTYVHEGRARGKVLICR